MQRERFCLKAFDWFRVLHPYILDHDGLTPFTWTFGNFVSMHSGHFSLLSDVPGCVLALDPVTFAHRLLSNKVNDNEDFSSLNERRTFFGFTRLSYDFDFKFCEKAVSCEGAREVSFELIRLVVTALQQIIRFDFEESSYFHLGCLVNSRIGVKLKENRWCASYHLRFPGVVIPSLRIAARLARSTDSYFWNKSKNRWMNMSPECIKVLFNSGIRETLFDWSNVMSARLRFICQTKMDNDPQSVHIPYAEFSNRGALVWRTRSVNEETTQRDCALSLQDWITATWIDKGAGRRCYDGFGAWSTQPCWHQLDDILRDGRVLRARSGIVHGFDDRWVYKRMAAPELDDLICYPRFLDCGGNELFRLGGDHIYLLCDKVALIRVNDQKGQFAGLSLVVELENIFNKPGKMSRGTRKSQSRPPTLFVVAYVLEGRPLAVRVFPTDEFEYVPVSPAKKIHLLMKPSAARVRSLEDLISLPCNFLLDHKNGGFVKAHRNCKWPLGPSEEEIPVTQWKIDENAFKEWRPSFDHESIWRSACSKMNVLVQQFTHVKDRVIDSVTKKLISVPELEQLTGLSLSHFRRDIPVLINLQAPCGSGKSFLLRSIVMIHIRKNHKVVVVVPRRTLVQEWFHELLKLCAVDEFEEGIVATYRVRKYGVEPLVLVICYNSLAKLEWFQFHPDVAIFDETLTLIDQAIGPTMDGRVLKTISLARSELLASVRLYIWADADFDPLIVPHATALFLRPHSAVDVYMLEDNNWKIPSIQKRSLLVLPPGIFNAHLDRSLDEPGKRLCVFSSTRKFVEEIEANHNFFRDLVVIGAHCYKSFSPLSDRRNPEATLSMGADAERLSQLFESGECASRERTWAAFFSPAMGTGASINSLAEETEVFALLKGHISVQQARQGMERLRVWQKGYIQEVPGRLSKYSSPDFTSNLFTLKEFMEQDESESALALALLNQPVNAAVAERSELAMIIAVISAFKRAVPHIERLMFTRLLIAQCIENGYRVHVMVKAVAEQKEYTKLLLQPAFTKEERREQFLKRVLECAKSYAFNEKILTEMCDSLYGQGFGFLLPIFNCNVSVVLWIEYLKIDRLRWLFNCLSAFGNTYLQLPLFEEEEASPAEPWQHERLQATRCGLYLFHYMRETGQLGIILTEEQIGRLNERSPDPCHMPARKIICDGLQDSSVFFPAVAGRLKRFKNWSSKELDGALAEKKYNHLFTANINIGSMDFRWVLHLARPLFTWMAKISCDRIKETRKTFEQWEKDGCYGLDKEDSLDPLPLVYQKKAKRDVNDDEN
jgi:hypothetical protein